MKKFLFLLLIVFLLLLTGCASKKTSRPERNCPIAQLLLDEEDYPEGTKFDTIDSPIGGDRPLSSAGQSAYYQESWVDQNVERYSFIEDAVEQYDQTSKRVFASDDIVGVWEIPPILILDNLSANRHEVGCATDETLGYRCYMIGQYEEYFVFYRVNIEPYGITHELYRDLVLKIDAEMASCLMR